MRQQTSKEQSCPNAPFRKSDPAKLVPYPGSDRFMRQRADLRSGSRQRRQRRALTPDVCQWFVSRIQAWPHPKELPVGTKYPLTWQNLIAQGEANWKWTWSKNGLSRHPEIAEAFAKRSRELVSGRNRAPRDPELADRKRGRDELLAIITRLEAEVLALKTRHRVWQKNAERHKLTVADLDQGWQPVDRGQTDIQLRIKHGLSLPQGTKPKPKAGVRSRPGR